MSEVLHVKKRTALGKRNNRKLRQSGHVPAVLYGHGEDSISLSVSSEEFGATLRHGSRVVDLDGDVQAQVLLQDVQWDTFFQYVLHVDMLRVIAGEKITISVSLETRGVAPGASEGVVELLVRELEIEVTPANVPEKLHLNINHLEMDQTLSAADIEDLPEGATILSDTSKPLVQCVARAIEKDEDEMETGAVEPEVIGAKKEEGSDEDSSK